MSAQRPEPKQPEPEPEPEPQPAPPDEPPPLAANVTHETGWQMQVLEPPLPAPLVEELLALWLHPEVFNHFPDDGEAGTRAQFAGAEREFNRHVLYVARAFSTLEGIGLSANDDYSIVSEAFPYLSQVASLT